MASHYSSEKGFVRDADKKKEKIAAAQQALSDAKSDDTAKAEAAAKAKAEAEAKSKK